MRRALLLLAPLALAAAACGGKDDTKLGGGAQFLPEDTLAFVAARGDSDWRPLARVVLGRTPPQVPAGADEVDLAIVRGDHVLVLTRKGDTWSGVPKATGRALARTPQYRAAVAAAPTDALAHAYLRGDVVKRRLQQVPGQITFVSGRTAPFRLAVHPRPGLTIAYLRFRWGSAWLTKDGEGLVARTAGLPVATSRFVRGVEATVPPYSPVLLDEIPANATSVLDLPLPLGTFELQPQAPPVLARLFSKADVLFRQQLDAILAGETAVYRRPGGEITLVTAPPDLAAADKALAALLPLLKGTKLYGGVVGGQLVLSTKPTGFAAFRGGGPKLSGDEAFKAAGFPARGTLFAYEKGRRAVWAVRTGQDLTYTVRFVPGHS